MKTKSLFLISMMLTLLLFLVLGQIDKPLQTEAAPRGIVSFELAKTTSESLAILHSWDAEAKIYAGLSLGIDYLFMVAYGGFFALAVLLLAPKLPDGFLKKTARIIAWLIFLAVLLDAIENYGLIRLLTGSPSQTWVSLAYYCAGLKFILLAIGVVYLISGLSVLALKKKNQKQD